MLKKRKQRDSETDSNCTTEVKRIKRQSEDFSNKLTLKEKEEEEEITTTTQNQEQYEQVMSGNFAELPESKIIGEGGGYQYYEGFNQYLKVLHMDRVRRLEQSGQNKLKEKDNPKN